MIKYNIATCVNDVPYVSEDMVVKKWTYLDQTGRSRSWAETGHSEFPGSLLDTWENKHAEN